MSESKKPWGNDNIFDWYREWDLEIAIGINEHVKLSIMDALGSIYEEIVNNKMEEAAKQLCMLAEIVVSANLENSEELLGEYMVELGMYDIDKNIEHFFEHHAEEYKEND
jgi:hypothetical protein